MKTYSAIPGDANKCECADPACPAHKGESNCLNFSAAIAYRVDMADNSGTLFCQDCLEDVTMSGLFTTEFEQ